MTNQWVTRFKPGDYVRVVPDPIFGHPTTPWVDQIESIELRRRMPTYSCSPYVAEQEYAIGYRLVGGVATTAKASVAKGTGAWEKNLQPATAEDRFRHVAKLAAKVRDYDADTGLPVFRIGTDHVEPTSTPYPEDIVVFYELLRRLAAGEVEDPVSLAQFIINPEKYELANVLEDLAA